MPQLSWKKEAEYFARSHNFRCYLKCLRWPCFPKDLIVSLRHGRFGAIDTDVIESSIEPAVSLDGKIDHDRDLSLVRNVAHYGRPSPRSFSADSFTSFSS